MKITFVLPGMRLTGGARVVFEYANNLQNRGHEVKIVYPLIPPATKKSNILKLKNQARGAMFNILKMNDVDWFNLNVKLIMVPTISQKWMAFIQWFIPDADAIVATSWDTAYAIDALNKNKGEKFYFIQHYEIWEIWNENKCWNEVEKKGIDPVELSSAMQDIRPKDSYLNLFKNRVDKTYKLSLKKITISSWLKNLLEKKFNEKVEALIINGINFNTFNRENRTNNTKKLRILMPYSPLKWKGSADGLKALEIVKLRYPDIEFVMYGDGNILNIPEWIKLYGMITDSELSKLYNSSDIFVFPSWVEGFGLPPLEAMACGCCVVATNTGGVPDYAINGDTILASPPRDPECMAKNILKIINDEDERKRISENGYNFVQQFTWERATIELENVLKKNI